MKPLAEKLRPAKFDDIINQDHLVGKNGIIKKMIENNSLSSIILSGSPGTGKTSIAKIIANQTQNSFFFNASTDKKSDLEKIIKPDNFPLLLVIDEIHRMKTDTQDFLLKYLESGEVKMIGLTTHNPYYKVNHAIRSRAMLLSLNDFDQNAIKKTIINYLKQINITNYDEEFIDYLSSLSPNDLRGSLNFLDFFINNQIELIKENIDKYLFDKNLKLDQSSDYHYQILSGLQKSIRGSDVDAALYYAARLIIMGDIDSLIRRLIVIAYEDIGIAAPQLVSRVKLAADAAYLVGLPEARIPLSNIVVELALAPKSNLAYSSLDKAINYIKQNQDFELPIHLKNEKLYLYPHNYDYAIVKQDYLPKEIKDLTFFEPKGKSQGEIDLANTYYNIKKAKNQK